MLLFSHAVVSDSFATPGTVAPQAPLSLEFSWQQYWSRLPSQSRGSSQPRNRTHIFCIASKFFTTDPSRKPICNMCLIAQLCLTVYDPMDCSLQGTSVQGDSPGKNTGMGCHFLLQGIIQIQGSNPGLLHGGQILYHLSHQGSLIWHIKVLKFVLIFLSKSKNKYICYFSKWRNKNLKE